MATRRSSDLKGSSGTGRLGEGVLAQFWHSCSPNGDGRDTERSGSALFVRKLWSHPPGLNRRPTDYESVALPAELGWPSGLRLKRSARFGTLLCDDNTMVIGPRLAVPICRSKVESSGSGKVESSAFGMGAKRRLPFPHP